MSLDSDLQALLEPASPEQSHPTQAQRTQPTAPRGWEAGVRFEPGGTMVVTAPPIEAKPGSEADWRERVEEMGLAIPDGFRVRLVEAKHDPAAWHRDAQGDDAVTRAVWRCRYVIEPATPTWQSPGDVDALVRAIEAERARDPLTEPDRERLRASAAKHFDRSAKLDQWSRLVAELCSGNDER